MSRHEIEISRKISAAHAITIDGIQEATHGHDFTFTARIACQKLDSNGLVCDFHQLEEILDDILKPFKNKNFNDMPPFNKENPTAEKIAYHIGSTLKKKLQRNNTLSWISVSEAPGCKAYWAPTPEREPEKSKDGL